MSSLMELSILSSPNSSIIFLNVFLSSLGNLPVYAISAENLTGILTFDK